MPSKHTLTVGLRFLFYISKNLVTRKAYLRFAPLTGNFHTSRICNWWDIKLLVPYSDIPFNTPADAAILYLVALFVSVPSPTAHASRRRTRFIFYFKELNLLIYKYRAKLKISIKKFFERIVGFEPTIEGFADLWFRPLAHMRIFCGADGIPTRTMFKVPH